MGSERRWRNVVVGKFEIVAKLKIEEMTMGMAFGGGNPKLLGETRGGLVCKW